MAQIGLELLLYRTFWSIKDFQTASASECWHLRVCVTNLRLTFFFFHLFMCHTCHCVCVEVGGQLSGVGSLHPLYRLWGSNLGQCRLYSWMSLWGPPFHHFLPTIGNIRMNFIIPLFKKYLFNTNITDNVIYFYG